MTELQGRIALVTGSWRGIGAAMARLFAQRGAAVLVHGRDIEAVKTVAADIEGTGGGALPASADLTRYEQIEAQSGIKVLSQELAAQTGPGGVRVNRLAPETILTERNRQPSGTARRRLRDEQKQNHDKGELK